MKGLITTFFFLAIIFATNLQACSCGHYEKIFCKNVNVNSIVVQAFVTERLNMSQMNIQIIKDFTHEYAGESIIVKGQDGLNCGEWLDNFQLGDTVIFALLSYASSDSTIWYLDGACGIHFLHFRNGMIQGQIYSDSISQTIEWFESNFMTCMDLQVKVDDINLNNIEVYPNPTSKILNIKSEYQIEKVEIYSVDGIKTEFSETESATELIINLEGIRSGMYMIIIQTTLGRNIRRIFKN